MFSAKTQRTALGAVLVVSALTLGCGGGGGPPPAGASNVSGNVATADTARLERMRKSWLAWLQEHTLGFVRSAYADSSLGGITVIGRSGNKEVSDVTDSSGNFALTKGPTGNSTLIFRRGGCDAQIALADVISQSTLVLADIDYVCTTNPGTADPASISETFLGVLRDNPESPDNPTRICVRVGDNDITRNVVIDGATIQNKAGQPAIFADLAHFDTVEVRGLRSTSGATSNFVVQNVRILDNNSRDKCAGPL
jgi:hypothetical protein